jgi:hypothetical protein
MFHSTIVWLNGIFSKKDLLFPARASQYRPTLPGQPKAADLSYIRGKQPRRQQLPKNRHPGVPLQLLADAEGLDSVMAPPYNLLCLVAHEHIGQMPRPEPLFSTVYTGQGLLCGQRAVPGFNGDQAVVTISAGPFMGFPKIVQNELPSANRRPSRPARPVSW